MKHHIRNIAAWLGLEPVTGLQRQDGMLIDYRHYSLSAKQFTVSAIIGGGLVGTGAYLFYHSAVISFLFAITGLLAPRFRRQSLKLQRQERLKLQFKEALFSLNSTLAAGRSLENAFQSALDDLQLLYPDPRTDLLRELQIICYRLSNAEPLEYALIDFARRAGVDEIDQFARAISIGKRSGGDLIEIVRRSTVLIGEKLEVQQEIALLIAQKKFEAKIMMVVPFFFLAFLSLAAPDYMTPLYSGWGYVLLSCALLLLLLCFWLINRIMTISL